MNRYDIIKKEFSHSFTGYDISEVDSFLDEVIRELDSRDHEKGLLEFRIEHELDVALKYIRLLRQQLEQADIEPLEIPVSISDDLKEIIKKEDARENMERARDRALFKSVHEAIAASDEICMENEAKMPEALSENPENGTEGTLPAMTAEKAEKEEETAENK